MSKKKLLEKLFAFLDQDSKERLKHTDELKVILKKLKKKERQLKKECEAETDKERKQVLCKEVDILHAQRKKGLKLIKEHMGKVE